MRGLARVRTGAASTPRRALAAGLVLLGTSLAGYGFATRYDAQGPVEPGPERALARSLAANAAKLGRFNLGVTHAARLRVTLAVTAAGDGEARPVELRAELRQTPTDIDASSALIRVELAKPVVSLPATGDAVASGAADAASRLERAFSRPFFARYAESGRLLELYFEKELPAAAGNVLGAVVARLQFVRQPELSGSVQREADEAGTYLAAYAELSERVFSKTKAGYVTADPASPAGALARVSKFESRIELFDSGWPKRWTLEEVLELPLSAAGGPSFQSRLALELEHARIASEPGLAGAFARERHLLAPRSFAPGETGEAASHGARDLLAGETFETLAARLATIAARRDRSKGDGRGRLVSQFRALFQVDPASLQRIDGLLRERPMEQVSVVVNALGLLDSEAGSAALERLLSDATVDDERRSLAVRVLGRTHHVPPSAERAVLELARSHTGRLGRVARLASGAMAYQLRKKEPQRSAELGRTLARELSGELDPERNEHWLIALGNAGDPAMLPTLLEIARSDSVGRGRRAIDALRRIEGPEVDAKLLDFMAAPEAWRRQAAVGALRLRDAGPFLARLVELARRDASEDVRVAAIQALARNLEQRPELATVLAKIATEDPSSTARQHASRLLSERSAPPEGRSAGPSDDDPDEP